MVRTLTRSTVRHVSEALRKPLDEVTIESIDRLTARAFKDHLLGLKKANGKPLALKSCQREMIIVAAAYRHAVRELEIQAGRDPFERLAWPKEQVSSLDKNVPLPDSVVGAVQKTLENGRSKDLPDMWQVLKGTGMRLGEACGLRVSDVDLTGETPSILITPNEINGIKNSNSNRHVPIASDRLKESLRARVAGRKGNEPLFPSYGRDGGPTAASAALMKAVRKNTDDKRMKVHGLGDVLLSNTIHLKPLGSLSCLSRSILTSLPSASRRTTSMPACFAFAAFSQFISLGAAEDTNTTALKPKPNSFKYAPTKAFPTLL